MNHDRELERGTRNFSMEYGKTTTSVSGRFQRTDPNSGMKKLIDPQEPSPMLILCVISILLDPLFLYIPVINDEKKLLTLDKKLAIAASVLRSVSDFFYIFFFILRFQSFLKIKDESQKINARKDLWRFLLIDLLAILPLPQVVIFIIIPTISRGLEWKAMSLLKYFVFGQYVLRLMRVYPLFTKATRNSSKLVDATWAKAAFNLLLYMLAAHVFGSLWYFFSIERETTCWKEACQKHSGCVRSTFYFDERQADHGFINEFCPIKTQNTTIFDFGIFYGALQSGIVEVTDFPQKFLHCFFWGLQSLSCLGQNLQTSTYIWEDLFAILVTISGLVLFVFLIGNLQMYLQCRTMRSEELRQKLQEIEQWDSYQKLSNPLQKQITKHRRHILRKTNGVDVEKFLSNLPRNLSREIKRELCLKLNVKVEEVTGLNGAISGELYDRLKPVFFTEHTHIVQEGHLIYEMLFVVKGKLCIYTSDPETNNDHDNVSVKGYLTNGDFCGEELIDWANPSKDDGPNSSNDHVANSSKDLPISTKTIEALTDVEAFALMSDDLKKVLQIKHLMHKRAACHIQRVWRSHRHKSNVNPTRSTGGNDSGLTLRCGKLLNAFKCGRLWQHQRTHPSQPPPIPATDITVEEP